MRTPALLALTLAFAAAVGPAIATDVTWGPGPVSISGTNDPSMALIAVNATTHVNWIGGGTLYTRSAPAGLHVYGFHVADAPSVVEPARLGSAVRSMSVAVGGGFTTTEFEYDLDGDGLYLPNERVYRVDTGGSFADPDYGATNAVLAVDIQRPGDVWIDDVDVYQDAVTAADLGFTDLGFESGGAGSFGAWLAGNDLEPPYPVRDNRTPYNGVAHALLPVSNDASAGDRPWVQQTTTGIPEKTLAKDILFHVTFWAKAPDEATCGAHVRTWDNGALMDDLEASADVTTTWANVDLTFDISEKSDDIELTLFCTRPPTFTGAATADFRLFVENA